MTPRTIRMHTRRYIFPGWLLVCSLIAGPLHAHNGHRDEPFLPAHTPSDPVIAHAGYTLLYSETHEQARWVACELTAAEVRGRVKRTNDFRPDPTVTTGSAALADYRRSGYDRGHLAPAADMKWSRTAMSESFFLSNMSPQSPGFNRGVWRELEELVRVWAMQHDALYVVTGPVLTQPALGVIGPNNVTVPAAYYKVLVDHVEPERKAIGFLLPHAASSAPLTSFAMPVDRIEQITGIDFFPALPDSLEEALESTLALAAWSWPGQRVAASGVTAETPSCLPWSSILRWLVIAVVVLVILVRFFR